MSCNVLYISLGYPYVCKYLHIVANPSKFRKVKFIVCALPWHRKWNKTMNRKLGNPEKISVERLSKKYANIRMTSISYFLYADCLKIENIGLVIVHAQYIMELDHWEPKGWYVIELKYRYNDLEIRSNIRCWLYQFQLIFFTLHVKHMNEKR